MCGWVGRMDNIHERLFNAYAYLCASIGAQLDLLAKDNDPEVGFQRARVISELIHGVSSIFHAVSAADDQVREYNPLTEVKS